MIMQERIISSRSRSLQGNFLKIDLSMTIRAVLCWDGCCELLVTDKGCPGSIHCRTESLFSQLKTSLWLTSLCVYLWACVFNFSPRGWMPFRVDAGVDLFLVPPGIVQSLPWLLRKRRERHALKVIFKWCFLEDACHLFKTLLGVLSHLFFFF